MNKVLAHFDPSYLNVKNLCLKGLPKKQPKLGLGIKQQSLGVSVLAEQSK